MAELTWTFETPHGPVTIPMVQAMKIVECLKELEAQGKVPIWHPNECGCCYTVHEKAFMPETAWLIGRDGGADLMTNHRHN